MYNPEFPNLNKYLSEIDDPKIIGHIMKLFMAINKDITDFNWIAMSLSVQLEIAKHAKGMLPIELTKEDKETIEKYAFWRDHSGFGTPS